LIRTDGTRHNSPYTPNHRCSDKYISPKFPQARALAPIDHDERVLGTRGWVKSPRAQISSQRQKSELGMFKSVVKPGLFSSCTRELQRAAKNTMRCVTCCTVARAGRCAAHDKIP
jgi:hypothetical protein